MKILWRLLAYLKFVFLPPLIASVFYLVEVAISTLARHIPTVLSLILYFCNNNLGEANIITQCATGLVNIAGFIHKLVYGLNGWLPVSFILTAYLFCLTFRLRWAVIRFFVKALTLGRL